MRRIAIVGTLLAMASGGCRDAGGVSAREVQGGWVPASAELAGQPFPEVVLKTMRLDISGSDYIVNVAGQLDKGTIHLIAKTHPAAMDIVGTEGPNQGKTFLAICERAGDTLRICYDLEGKQRPSGFATAGGTKQFLVHYIPAKP